MRSFIWTEIKKKRRQIKYYTEETKKWEWELSTEGADKVIDLKYFLRDNVFY